MKATLLARSVYLSIALIVTLAIGGCYTIPITYYKGPAPGAIETGKTTKAKMLEELDGPDARTVDGRFFLYRYSEETEWLGVLVLIPMEGPIATTHEPGRLLIEFDKNETAKRYVDYKCEKKKADPICDGMIESALWTMIEALLGKETTAEYRQAVVLAESLAEPLHKAVARGDLEEIKRLIAQGASVHAWVNGRTPLHAAALSGNTAVIELLIAEGANVNASNASGQPPLVVNKDDTPVVELLTAKGADVNVFNQDGLTPLHEAARQGETARVEQLLAKGARANARTRWSNQSVLGWAAFGGDARMVELLLVNGADPNAKDKNGYSPLHWAVWNGDPTIVELLIAKGAEVNAKAEWGRTPLHEAIKRGHTAAVQVLLARGADVNAKEKLRGGDRPMGLAITLGHEEIIELLKRHGAKE